MVLASSALSSFFCYRGLASIGQPSVDTSNLKHTGAPVLSSFVFLYTTRLSRRLEVVEDHDYVAAIGLATYALQAV